MEGRFIGGIGGIIRAGEAIVGGWKGNVIVRVVSGIRRVNIVIRRVNFVSGTRRVSAVRFQKCTGIPSVPVARVFLSPLRWRRTVWDVTPCREKPAGYLDDVRRAGDDGGGRAGVPSLADLAADCSFSLEALETK